MPGRSTNVGYGHALYKFTGKERDREAGIGLDYFGARYYDPEIGRWLSVDPLHRIYLNITPYHYTKNNPINRIDRYGMIDERAVGKAFLRIGLGTASWLGGTKLIIVSLTTEPLTFGSSTVGVIGGIGLLMYGSSEVGFGVKDLIVAL